MKEPNKNDIATYILKTTPRTVEIMADAIFADGFNKETFEDMIFNDKEFISYSKYHGEEVEYREKNNVNGNRITIKYLRLNNKGKEYKSFSNIITRKKIKNNLVV